MHKSFIIILSFGMMLISCSGTKPAQNQTTTIIESEEIAVKNEPAWAPKVYDYKASIKLPFKLIHTKLEVRFDWENAYLIGKANLSMHPWFYPTNELILDAKGFEIKSVSLAGEGSGRELKYEYDGKKLKVILNKTYTREEQFEIAIDYVAKPNELNQEGSEAISEAKGLYFINPDGSDPAKPKQIWTQGETEASSCWFPTFDSPNAKTSQETIITVDEKYVTLSNGKLINSSLNDDGTRTDHWKQELPHAPYLFMIAVGEFSIVKDEWRGKEVNYYVEKKYEPYAKLIFGDTPEMLEFFSTRLGVEYPWDKFSQIVVRDFVSGAMENTSAVIHFEPVAHTAREHLDNPFQDIIAHELFHHWFGDMVTCESWANLPLNESFATYGEYLWNEYKYGKDFADKGLLDDLNIYVSQSKMKREPLIRYHVKHADNMFDTHSYQKGGRVLHMLRKQVGDDAFFKSLETYLKDNAFTDVEIHDLRLAFEKVTGEDLNWFFNQWFLAPGHPELSVDYLYSEENKTLSVQVQQTQDLDYIPIYRLPLKIEMVNRETHRIEEIEIATADTTLIFDVDKNPDYIVFDSEKNLLGEVKETKSTEEWAAQLRHGKNYIQKSEAFSKLSLALDNDLVVDAMIHSLQDSYFGLRARALSSLQLYAGNRQAEVIELATQLAIHDQESKVRKAAISLLGFYAESLNADPDQTGNSGESADKMRQVIENAVMDSSYGVAGIALQSLYHLDAKTALEKAKILQDDPSGNFVATIAEIYMNAGEKDADEFIRENLPEMKNGMKKMGLITNYADYLAEMTVEERKAGVKVLMGMADSDGVWWSRISPVQALFKFIDDEGVKDFLTQLKEKESNPTLKQMIEGQLGSGE